MNVLSSHADQACAGHVTVPAADQGRNRVHLFGPNMDVAAGSGWY